MNKSETIKELALALSKAQAEMPSAELNAYNPFFKSNYADLGSIIKAAKPVLAKHGLSLSQLPTSDNGSIGVTTVLMHSSGEWIESTMTLPVGEEKGKSSAQIAGSIISYLRRYSIASVLGMYADEDTDGNIPQLQPKPKAKQPEKQSNGRLDLQAVVDAGYAENIHAAKNALTNYCATGYDTTEKALAWMKMYRGWRDTDLPPQEAAEKANAGEMPK